MKYRLDKNGNQISQLGFGCMRFIKKGTAIDYELAQKQVMLAIEKGVNYFDTVSDEIGILNRQNLQKRAYKTQDRLYRLLSYAHVHRHFGLGKPEKIRNAYDWDFCQIQYNYLDEHTQAGRQCEQHCPQNIKIIERLKEADKALRPLPYKIGINIARKFLVK